MLFEIFLFSRIQPKFNKIQLNFIHNFKLCRAENIEACMFLFKYNIVFSLQPNLVKSFCDSQCHFWLHHEIDPKKHWFGFPTPAFFFFFSGYLYNSQKSYIEN